jgi:uncharacterized protein YndB with AHSA1/START domain
MTNPFTVEYTISREFDAPVEEVFAAWTEPDRFARWFGPRAFTTPPRVSMDLRPGGAWQAVLVTPDGNEVPLGGWYREIEAPKRLVFTTGDPDNTEGALASVATVELAERDGRTTMTFHQAGVNTPPEHAEGARAGWLEFFDRLTEQLP